MPKPRVQGVSENEELKRFVLQMNCIGGENSKTVAEAKMKKYFNFFSFLYIYNN